MNQRREFFRTAFQVLGAGLLAKSLLPSLAQAEERRRSSGAASAGSAELAFPMVEPGKDAALPMRYYHSHEEAKKDTQVNKSEKAGLPWEKQLCSNCSFYKASGKKKVKINGKEVETEVGTCTIFPKKLVASQGFCNSWAKKA